MKTFWQIASCADIGLALAFSLLHRYDAAAFFMAWACFAEIKIQGCQERVP